MPVFHVYLNSKKVSSAGVGELGVLGAHVSWVRRKGEHTLAKKPESIEEELALMLAVSSHRLRNIFGGWIAR